MATGEMTHGATAAELVTDERSAEALPDGAAITSSGRVSVAKMYEPAGPNGPFSAVQLTRLDEALTLSSRETGLDFSIYLGELGDDTRAKAEELHSSIDSGPDNAVLIAVSPGERAVELVTGATAVQRVTDRSAKFAVMSMVASFKEGDLIGGLVSGLRMMTEQAGPA